MEFLCSAHRRQFADMSLDQQRELWLVWMECAQMQYRQQDWRAVVSLSGCAFELACLARARNERCMHIELTLAAIYVTNALTAFGDPACAEQIVYQALDALLPDELCMAGVQGSCGISECMEVLLDTSRQQDFFEDYLNWPFFPTPPDMLGRWDRIYH
ncbi:MAG: hypothetical protein LAT63_00550 [Marinobacter sp.]|nr:hypothetical protein [Marinobacter sp.]